MKASYSVLKEVFERAFKLEQQAAAATWRRVSKAPELQKSDDGITAMHGLLDAASTRDAMLRCLDSLEYFDAEERDNILF